MDYFNKIVFSHILWLVHIAKQSIHWDGTYGFSEKQFFDCGGVNGSESGKHKKQLAKSGGLCWICSRNVFAQSKLCLILQCCDCRDILDRPMFSVYIFNCCKNQEDQLLKIEKENSVQVGISKAINYGGFIVKKTNMVLIYCLDWITEEWRWDIDVARRIREKPPAYTQLDFYRCQLLQLDL